MDEVEPETYRYTDDDTENDADLAPDTERCPPPDSEIPPTLRSERGLSRMSTWIP